MPTLKRGAVAPSSASKMVVPAARSSGVLRSASAADDSFVWPYTSGADSDTTAIGWMANETYNSWSPASTIDDVNLMAFGKGRSKC